MATETNYIWNFWLYEGKEESERASTTEQIVLDFINSLPFTKGVTVFADSYYGSFELVCGLQQLGTLLVLSQNRKISFLDHFFRFYHAEKIDLLKFSATSCTKD